MKLLILGLLPAAILGSKQLQLELDSKNSSMDVPDEVFASSLTEKNHGHNPHGHNPHVHTPYPTTYPSKYPTMYPTVYPTTYPTPEPTSFPTPEPTPFPTPDPTPAPSPFPTEQPTFGQAQYKTAPGPSDMPTPPPYIEPNTPFHRACDVCLGSSTSSKGVYSKSESYMVEGCLKKCDNDPFCQGFNSGYAGGVAVCEFIMYSVTDQIDYLDPKNTAGFTNEIPEGSVMGSGNTVAGPPGTGYNAIPPTRSFGCYLKD